MRTTPSGLVGVAADIDAVETYVATRPTVAAATTPDDARAAWETFCAALTDAQTAALARAFFAKLPEFIQMAPLP